MSAKRVNLDSSAFSVAAETASTASAWDGLKQIPAAVAVLDLDFRYVFASDRWLEFWALGMSALEHLDYSPQLSVGSCEWQEAHRLALAGLETGQDADPWVSPDGRIRHVKWTLSPWLTPGEDLAGVMVCVEDVSVRACQQKTVLDKAAGEREDQRKALLHYAELGSDYLWETDVEHRFVTFSDTVFARSGVLVTDFLGKRRWELPYVGIDEEGWEKHRSILNQRMPIVNFELGFVNQSGDLRWVKINGDPFFDREGVFKGYRGVTCDITDKKLEHERLRQASILFNVTQEGVAITDKDGRVLSVNRAFTRVTEYDESDILGRDLSVLQSGRHDLVSFFDIWEVLVRDGTWRGEIWNKRKGGDVCAQWMQLRAVHDAKGNVINFVVVLTDLTRMSHVETEYQHLAHHDSLTDLPNRVLFTSRLDQAIKHSSRTGKQAAVMFLDLDGFKAVNDTYGHRVGDELLKAVAVRLKRRMREVDTVCRLGGDEFAILAEDLSSPAAAAAIAVDITEQLRLPFSVAGAVPITIGCSIGVSLLNVDSADPAELLEFADVALYRVKQSGKGHFEFYGWQEAS